MATVLLRASRRERGQVSELLSRADRAMSWAELFPGAALVGCAVLVAIRPPFGPGGWAVGMVTVCLLVQVVLMYRAFALQRRASDQAPATPGPRAS